MAEKARTYGRIRHELEERTSYRFSLIAFKQTRCLAGMYTNKFDISVNGWKMLSVIGRFSPLSASTLAKKTATTGDKVSREVDQLVTSGMVRRKIDRNDRRRIILTLSAKGKRIYRSIEAILKIIEDEFLAKLSDSERECLYTVLGKLEARAAELFDRKDAWRHIVENHYARPAALHPRQTDTRSIS